MEYYRDRGYIRAQVGEPEVRVLGDSKDEQDALDRAAHSGRRKGNATRSRSFDVAGNTVVKSDALRPLFKLQQGEYYSQKEVRKGFQKAQEIYGAGGYMEFTGYPDYKFSDEPESGRARTRPRRSRRVGAERSRRAADRRRHAADSGRQAVLRQPDHLHRQHDDARQRHPARDCGCTRTASSTPRR